MGRIFSQEWGGVCRGFLKENLTFSPQKTPWLKVLSVLALFF